MTILGFFFTEIKLKQQLEKISHMVKRFHMELRDIKPTPECKKYQTNRTILTKKIVVFHNVIDNTISSNLIYL